MCIEPEIKDLVNYLNKLGGKINIKKEKLQYTVLKKQENFTKVMFDRIELGTYLISAGTAGNKFLSQM